MSTCIREMPTLWPPADFAIGFRSDGEIALHTIPQHLDMGALEFDPEGCLLILMVGGPGDLGYTWERYNPSNFTHFLEANKFARYGRGHSRGHAHGRDDIATIAYTIWPRLFGRPATKMDEIDTYYRRGENSRWWVYDLIAQYEKLTGENTTPPVVPTVPIPPIPPVSLPPVIKPNPTPPVQVYNAQLVNDLKAEIQDLNQQLEERSSLLQKEKTRSTQLGVLMELLATENDRLKEKLNTSHPPFVKATIDALLNNSKLPITTINRVKRVKAYLFPTQEERK